MSGRRSAVRSLVALVYGMIVVATACGRIGFDPADGAGPDAASGDPGVRSGPVQVHVQSFRTSSPTFVPVTGGEITFTPERADQGWILMVSALLGSSSLSQESVEARYLLNGEERGLGGVQNTVGYAAGPWQHFDRISGVTGAQTIAVELRDVTGSEAVIEDLRLIAFPWPGGREAFQRSDAIRQVAATDWTVVETFDFSAPSPGDYLLLGLLNTSERPNSNIVAVRWRMPDGSTSTDSYSNRRVAWQSIFVARLASLPAGDHRMELEAAAGSPGSIRYVRHMALPLADVEAFYSQTDDAEVSTATEAVVSTLDVPAAATAAPHLVIQSLQMTADPSDSPRSAVFERSGTGSSATLMTLQHVLDNHGHDPTYGPFWLYRTAAAFDVTTRLVPMGGTVTARQSVIHVLRLP